MVSLLSKVAEHQAQYGRALQRTIEQEKTKHEVDFAKDKQRSCVAGWEGMLDALQASGAHSAATADRVLAEVVTPLQDCYANGTARLQEVGKEQRRAVKEMAQLHAAVQSELTGCSRLLQQVDTMRDEGRIAAASSSSSSFSPPSQPERRSGGLLSKLQSKIEKVTLSTPAALNERLMQQAGRYQTAIDRANARQAQLLQVDLPAVLSSLESLERTRLACVATAVQQLAAVYNSGQPAETEIVQRMATASRGLQPEADIASLVQGLVMLHGPAPAPTVYAYALPCSVADIRAGRYEGAANSVFHTTAAHAMELQPGEIDGVAVPRLVAECVRCLRRDDGLSLEGVFRVSPSKVQLDEARERLQQGDYAALERCDAHVSAALLKDWMRSLSSPLVPDALYDDAVAVAKADMAAQGSAGHTGGLQAALALYRKLDDVNRNVLTVIARVAHEVTQERRAQSNRMSYESLSIVLAPCWLRCSSLDPAVVFANTRFETRFTLLLLHALAPASN